ncbi:hypothetical protein V6N13_117774 [Hibiscus sabdariffa]|uniref:START domain-containing protein n=1 Tax=Hibiscus sabdariffa TaxID=183260 RepID=A0ABR2Q9T5_9ROSI
MDPVGGNGANGSGDNQNGSQPRQSNHGGIDVVLNVVVTQEEEPMEEDFEEALSDETEDADGHVGLAEPAGPISEVIDTFVVDGDVDVVLTSMLTLPPPRRSQRSEPRTNVAPNHMNNVAPNHMNNVAPNHMNGPNNPFIGFLMGVDPNKIIGQATRAMEELVKMATMGPPMWQRNGEIEILSGHQYLREFGCAGATMEDIMRMVEVGQHRQPPSSNGNNSYFPRDIPTLLSLTIGSEPLHIEASRDIGFVKMDPTNIVALLMDWNQWLMAFPSIVARATLQGVILGSADGSYNGVLQVMTAEFHQSTPLIPSRQSYFARYCKMITPGTWAVVDVCLENLLPYPQFQFRRRPSGCLIELLPHIGNYCKISWVEHVEADHSSLHPLFGAVVASGFAFGARRWIAALNRHCQWLATSMASSIPTYSGVLIRQPGRESVLKLVESMRRIFFMNVSPCAQSSWMRMPSNFAAEDVRIRFGNVLDIPGRPPSNTIIFTTSIRIPAPLRVLFDFLNDVRHRTTWDLFTWGRVLRELGHVRTGDNPKNRVSIIQVNSARNRTKTLYLQESYYNEAGSYVVYEALDKYDMAYILNGGDPNIPAFLPSGLTILPEMPPGLQDEPMGSILTMSFQVDTSSNDEFIPPSTFNTINAFLEKTIASFRDVFR